jgi:protease-4
VRTGEYKSAADMLLGTGMTPWEREADSTMLHAFHAELFRGVAEGTGLEGAQLLRILELGTVMPEQAVELGMVDGTAYPRELEEEVSRIAGHGVRTVELGAWGAERPVEEAWGPPDRIVVIAATGFITSGRSGSMFPLGETMGSGSICDLVEDAVSTPGVRAVVIRIDSGGGEGFASEEMHHCISEASGEMPVVASMGAVAASGGYYMACGADSIFADRFTVTGSIGVISGKLAFNRMLAGIGINYDGIEPYAMSGMYSPFTELTDAQRARMEELNRQSYDLFVDRVAGSREMTPDEVDSVGRGRVWAGADALERGLVDRIGGVLDAVECAARMAGLRPGSYEVEVLPRPGLFEGFGLPIGGLVSADLSDLAGAAGLFDRPLFLASPVIVE